MMKKLKIWCLVIVSALFIPATPAWSVSVGTSVDLANAFNNQTTTPIDITGSINLVDMLNARTGDLAITGNSNTLTLNNNTLNFQPNWDVPIAASITQLTLQNSVLLQKLY